MNTKRELDHSIGVSSPARLHSENQPQTLDINVCKLVIALQNPSEWNRVSQQCSYGNTDIKRKRFLSARILIFAPAELETN